MKIITASAKIIKVFSTKIIIICADSLYSTRLKNWNVREFLNIFTSNMCMNF